MRQTIFSLGGYRSLLAALIDLGYRAASFCDAEPQRRDLLLRHDIDMSIQAAVPIAEIESALGVTATYFVLVRTEMYNPFSRAARQDLLRIAGLGHQIGLHLDCSLYVDDIDSLNRAAAVECRILEDVIGRTVKLVSFHRPAKALLGNGALIAGRPHTYMPRFFSEIGYCSDSRGAWDHGHPLDHPAVAAGRALHLLTHPIWWHGIAPRDASQRLEDFAEERRKLLRQELAANCKIFVADLPVLPNPNERKREHPL